MNANSFSEVVKRLNTSPCTMKLTGFCLAENNYLGISGKWQNFCANNFCEEDTSGSCSKCGRNIANYLEIDSVSIGLLSCWEIGLDSGGRLGLIILDHEYTSAVLEVLRMLAIEDSWTGNYPQTTLNLINAWLRSVPNEYEIYHKGKLELTENPVWKDFVSDSGIAIIGESRQGKNSNFPLFTFDHFKTGETHVFEIYGQTDSATTFKKAILIASNEAVTDLNIPLGGHNPYTHPSLTVSPPPFGIPSYAIATCWINSQIKNFESKDLGATQMPEGTPQGYLDHLEALKAMFMMEINSWVILQKVNESQGDFKSILERELPDLSQNWKDIVMQLRGQI